MKSSLNATLKIKYLNSTSSRWGSFNCLFIIFYLSIVNLIFYIFNNLVFVLQLRRSRGNQTYLAIFHLYIFVIFHLVVLWVWMRVDITLILVFRDLLLLIISNYMLWLWNICILHLFQYIHLVVPLVFHPFLILLENNIEFSK